MMNLIAQEKLFDLSANQKRLFTYHKMYPEDPSYNLSFLYKITGDFDIIRFKRSFESLLRTIPALNSYFYEENGAAKIKYVDGKRYEVPIYDYSLDRDYEENIQRYVQEQNDKVILLTSWPLYQTALFIAPNNQYYFTITVAHIIADGYSYYTFLEDLAQIYNADIYPEDREDHLNISGLTSENTERSISFFKEQLKGLDSLSIKEINCLRDQQGRLHGKNTSFTLEKELSRDIRKFLAAYNISEFTFFLSNYTVLMNKLFNKENIVVGVPLPNRLNKNSKKVFGYLVNTLPLSIQCQSSETFKDLCFQARKKMFSLLKFQNFNLSAFTSTQEQSFSTMNNAFTYYKQELKFQLNGCQTERLPINLQYVKFPFTMNVEDLGEDFRIHIEYTPLFNHIQFKETFQHMIQAIVSNHSISISEIELLNEKQKNQINQLVNTSETLVKIKNINDRFDEVCEKFTNEVAVKTTDRSTTYKELHRLADQIAHNLTQEMDENERFVLVTLDRTEKLIATILGILKAGKTYIPIDPNSPTDRFAYIAHFVSKAAIITDRPLPIPFEGKIFHIDSLLCNPKILTKLPDPKPNDIAYIIFTSGSTGKPKGVEVTHHNVARLFETCHKQFDFTPQDIWTLFHSYAFDFSIWEIFGPILFGGKLIIVPDDAIKSPYEFYQLLKREKVTILNQTPSFFRQLIKVDQRESSDELSLRAIVFGGEKLHFNMLKPWIEKHSLDCKLINMYGITETTVHTTFYDIQREDIEQDPGSIIGKPLDDLRMYIVNQDLQMVPVGIPGEILVAGEGVSNGYHGQEDLTKERFIAFQNERAKVYRTGDLAKVLPDGRVQYINRIDKQIQLRGYRIELEEIEKAIHSLGICDTCILIVHEFSEEDKRLLAYLVMKEESDINQVKWQLSKKLPAYMIPSHFIRIDEAPLTLNGKIDVEALPKPFIIKDTRVSEAKMSETEETVWKIWRETIKTEEIGLDDNFFDVGGTSLHVTEIYYKVKEIFDLESMAIIDLFEYTTIKSLSIYIEELLAQKETLKDDGDPSDSLYLSNRKRVLVRKGNWR
jgi:amino acid adenylation domain-containing protein